MTESLDRESIDPLTTEHPEASEHPEPGEPATPVELPTPGMVLRRAREERGHSIADVVQVIRFSARQIEALERDDYASLPGSTAVRGLVRNYAKFLKLDAAPLLAQLAPAVPVPEPDVRPLADLGEAKQPGIVERIQPRMLAAGVAVVLLGLGAYGYSSLPGDSALARLWRSVEGGSAVSSPASVAAPAVTPVLAPAPMVVAENGSPDTSATSSPPPFIGLRVEFDDRSWIEIRDATQKVVFVGEYPAGTRRNVEGKAPFQLWIGKASGVRVFLGERGIDLKPHTREDIARFNLE